MSKRTVLFPEHKAAEGVMVGFAGWEMPLHYGSQSLEHLHVRKDAGMFDVSHMGVMDVSGKDSRAYLSELLANNINKLSKPGMGMYSCMLNEMGGILDDLIVYFVKEDFYRLVVNAATTQKDLTWMCGQTKNYAVNINLHSDLAIIAVQGPLAIEKTIAALGEKYAQPLSELKRFACIQIDDIFIARTGYTGENGLELIIPATKAIYYWRALLKQKALPIGLGARDTLRLEAGYNLYGNDMDEGVTPLESNLSWTVALEPHERNFIGRSALHTQSIQGVPSALIGIKLQGKGVLRHGQKIYHDDKEVGVVTSGTFSPSLQIAIGMARVAMPINKDYFVDIRGAKHALSIVALPFI